MILSKKSPTITASSDSPTVVVSDTTAISELAKVNRLDLLPRLFRRILIPTEVYDEIVSGNHPARQIIESLKWVITTPVQDPAKVADLRHKSKMGFGECAAIVLAEETQADYLLLDDQKGRKEAKSRGLPLIGIVGVLLLAKQEGLIAEVRGVLDELISKGMRIGRPLYELALKAAKENGFN